MNKSSKNEKRDLSVEIESILDKNCISYEVIADKIIREKIRLDGHPFELDTWDIESIYDDEDRFWLVGRIGSTNVSTAAIVRHINKCTTQAILIKRLRIILAARESILQHDVFFEVKFGSDTFICGGCTDCSGEGKRGMKAIEEIFELLSDTYGTEIEHETISRAKSSVVKRSLEEME